MKLKEMTTPMQTAKTGTITQATAKDVTIDNKDGTKTIAPTTLLSRDDKGNLVFNKQMAASTQSTPQQKPIQAGQSIQINAGLEVDKIKKLSGLS